METVIETRSQRALENDRRRRHKLMPVKLARLIPPLGSQDGKGDETVIYAKFFMVCGGWTWYVAEFDGVDQCFGLVQGVEREWGYFSLRELSELRDTFGWPAFRWIPAVERDKFWRPKRICDLGPND